MHEPQRSIRPFQDADEAAVVRVWHRSGRAAYTFLPTWQALTIEQAHTLFHTIIRPRCTIWVGLRDEQIVAYLALNQSYVDRLYVDPTEWRMGWGRRLITLAKTFSPHGFELRSRPSTDWSSAGMRKNAPCATTSRASPTTI